MKLAKLMSLAALAIVGLLAVNARAAEGVPDEVGYEGLKAGDIRTELTLGLQGLDQVLCWEDVDVYLMPGDAALAELLQTGRTVSPMVSRILTAEGARAVYAKGFGRNEEGVIFVPRPTGGSFDFSSAFGNAETRAAACSSIFSLPTVTTSALRSPRHTALRPPPPAVAAFGLRRTAAVARRRRAIPVMDLA